MCNNTIMNKKKKRPRLVKDYAKVDVQQAAKDIRKNIIAQKKQFSYKKDYLIALGYTVLSNKDASKIDIANKVVINKIVDKFFRLERQFS